MKVLLCIGAFLVGCILTLWINPAQEKSTIESRTSSNQKMGIESKPYGETRDGQKVTQYICRNKNGLMLELIDYGATVTAVKTPDRNGKLANITLSCSDIKGYQECGSYFGCSTGRFCNRIAKGKFSIDGNQYTLATNNGPNHLHGGASGFDKKMWKAEQISNDASVGVRFKLISPDGDEGYPGKLEVTVEYLLTNDDQLVIDFIATSDKPTHVNLTNHCYWNLSGAGNGTVFDHELKIEADKYLPVDDTGIPTGKMVDVKGTDFDFTRPYKIGERLKNIGQDPAGYDHNFVLRNQTGKMALAAVVKDPASGRVMEISTTQPGIQFYTGNYLDGSAGSGGFAQYGALCLETQHYPDSPNQPNFPSTLLKPGERYQQKTIHQFRVN